MRIAARKGLYPLVGPWVRVAAVSGAAVLTAGSGCGDADRPGVWFYNESDERVVVTNENGLEVAVSPGERAVMYIGGQCAANRLRVETAQGASFGEISDERMCQNDTSLYILGPNEFRVEER